MPQSVLVWDGVRIEMERAAQNHVKISLLPEMIQLQGDPLHADGLCGGIQRWTERAQATQMDQFRSK